jgi:DNA-binding protein Fis
MSELNDVRELTGELLADRKDGGGIYRALLAEVDRAVLGVVIARCGGNQKLMASVLGLSRTTLRGKLKRAGIKADGRQRVQDSKPRDAPL